MRHFFCGLAMLVLAASAHADVDSLIKDLGSKDSDIRRAAARQLGEMGPEAKTAAGALTKSLKDEDVFVRRFAVQALGNLGEDVSGVVPALTTALKDSDKRVIQAAAEALGKTGAAGVKPLAEIAKDKTKDGMTRVKAVQSLGKIGKGAKDAVPTLVEIVKEPGKRNDANQITMRTEAATALGNIGPDAKEAVKTLEEIAADRQVRDRGLKQAVQQAIKKINK